LPFMEAGLIKYTLRGEPQDSTDVKFSSGIVWAESLEVLSPNSFWSLVPFTLLYSWGCPSCNPPTGLLVIEHCTKQSKSAIILLHTTSR
jgi:hypothetical protein